MQYFIVRCNLRKTKKNYGIVTLLTLHDDLLLYRRKENNFLEIKMVLMMLNEVTRLEGKCLFFITLNIGMIFVVIVWI